MARSAFLLSALLLVACGDAARPHERTQGVAGAPTLGPAYAHVIPEVGEPRDGLCPAPAPSRCSTPHEGSIIRGTIRMRRGLAAPPRGKLVVALTRYRGQGEYATGGHLHVVRDLGEVDLSRGPVPFQIDMCDAGHSAWVEDACEMNLIVILDVDGNNVPLQPLVAGEPVAVPFNAVPDQGEAAARLLVSPSCHRESACLDVVLDCTDGAACVAYDEPSTCMCGESTCGSDWMLCSKDGPA